MAKISPLTFTHEAKYAFGVSQYDETQTNFRTYNYEVHGVDVELKYGPMKGDGAVLLIFDNKTHDLVDSIAIDTPIKKTSTKKVQELLSSWYHDHDWTDDRDVVYPVVPDDAGAIVKLGSNYK